jgi:lactose/L-arabinose transport system permease protein
MKAITAALKHLFLIICSLISVFPFYWMIVSSTNEGVEVMRGRLLPGTHLIDNITGLANSTYLHQAVLNSLRNASIQTVFSLAVCSVAGYGFIIYKDKAKNAVMNLLLLSMMVPAATTIIPLFRLFSRVGLIDTLPGFILPSISTAFLIFFFRQNTVTFPQEMIQAARVDGLGELGIFIRIYMPIMKPSYAAATTIVFMGAWNAYLWPLIVLQSQENQTLPMLISSMLSRPALDYAHLMLAVTITTLPTLILFSVLQRSFVEGVLGAVKS